MKFLEGTFMFHFTSLFWKKGIDWTIRTPYGQSNVQQQVNFDDQGRPQVPFQLPTSLVDLSPIPLKMYTRMTLMIGTMLGKTWSSCQFRATRRPKWLLRRLQTWNHTLIDKTISPTWTTARVIPRLLMNPNSIATHYLAHRIMNPEGRRSRVSIKIISAKV